MGRTTPGDDGALKHIAFEQAEDGGNLLVTVMRCEDLPFDRVIGERTHRACWDRTRCLQHVQQQRHACNGKGGRRRSRGSCAAEPSQNLNAPKPTISSFETPLYPSPAVSDGS